MKRQHVTCFHLLPLTGSKDGNVLPEDEARGEPHPVHSEQGEAEGGTGARQGLRGRGERTQHGCHGVFSEEPGRVPHVRILNMFTSTESDVEALRSVLHVIFCFFKSI